MNGTKLAKWSKIVNTGIFFWPNREGTEANLEIYFLFLNEIVCFDPSLEWSL